MKRLLAIAACLFGLLALVAALAFNHLSGQPAVWMQNFFFVLLTFGMGWLVFTRRWPI